MSHTPGPWRTHLVDSTSVVDATGDEVAWMQGAYKTDSDVERMEANARLIAAAPDLLEALKQVRLHSAMPHTLREQIEAAIAKAEGR